MGSDRTARVIVYGAVGMVAFSVALVLAFVAKRIWPAEPTRIGTVVAYRAVGDTAFLLWRVDEPEWRTSGWLSRVDASGRTMWIRKLPASPHSGDAIHVGAAVVAVRYSHNEDGHDQDHSIVAFTFDGKQVWDRVLTPYRPQSIAGDPRNGPTSANVGEVGGIAVHDHFVEWVDVETDLKMLGVNAKDGRTTWTQSVGAPPLAASAIGTRLVWHAPTSSALQRAQDRSNLGTAALISTDVITGNSQTTMTLGKGCMVADEYVAVVDRGGEPSLVGFRGGDLDAVRVIAEPFEPLGPEQRFSVQRCGRYKNSLVFVLDRPQQKLVGDTAPQLVITDASGSSIRTAELPFDLDDFMSVPGRREALFAAQTPFSGELTRFVPITRWSSRAGDVLALLDLEGNATSLEVRLPGTEGTLVRVGQKWYVGRNHDRGLQIAVVDGDQGALVKRTEVSSSGLRGIVEARLLPSHVANGKLWVVSYDSTRLDDPPVALLDAASLQPVYTSRHVSISERSEER